MKADIYQQITDRILSTVDDAGNWKPCWVGAGISRPHNALTGKPYRGSNVLTCWVTCSINDYPINQWASYRQWAQLGAQVKKGEKGTPIIFYKKVEKKTDEESYLLARSSYVFNRSQVENAPPLDTEQHDPLTDEERLAHCESWLESVQTKARIQTSDDGRAYFNYAKDFIALPPFENFHEPESYYAVAAHELIHWTGHKSRLDRGFDPLESKSDYAKEELVAEIGSAFLAAELGIEPVTRDSHLAYIKGWLKLLKNDKKLIVHAAAQAERAAGYIETMCDEWEDVPFEEAA